MGVVIEDVTDQENTAPATQVPRFINGFVPMHTTVTVLTCRSRPQYYCYTKHSIAACSSDLEDVQVGSWLTVDAGRRRHRWQKVPKTARRKQVRERCSRRQRLGLRR